MRHMTAAAKRAELASWEGAKLARQAAPPQGFSGGYGYPDPEIYDYVDRINAMHRLCTLQSCAGHRCTSESCCQLCAEHGLHEGLAGDGEHVWNGQLWIWPDAKMARWLYEHLPQLAQVPRVEKVTLLFHVEGREILDLQFQGDGHYALDISMHAILEFLERGSLECNLS